MDPRVARGLPLSLFVALLLILITIQIYYIWRLTLKPYTFFPPSSSQLSSDSDQSIYSFYEHINRIMGLSEIPTESDGEGKVMMEEMYRRLKTEFEERRKEEGEGMMLEDWEVEGWGKGGMWEGKPGAVEKGKELEKMVESGKMEVESSGEQEGEGERGEVEDQNEVEGDGGMMIEKWEEKMGDADYVKDLKEEENLKVADVGKEEAMGEDGEMMVGKWEEKMGDSDYIKNWKKKPIVDGSLTGESKKEAIAEILNNNGTAKDIMKALKGKIGAI